MTVRGFNESHVRTLRRRVVCATTQVDEFERHTFETTFNYTVLTN